MDDDTLLYWLLLQQLPGLGNRTLARIAADHGDPSAILELSDAALAPYEPSREWVNALRRARARRDGEHWDAARAARDRLYDAGAQLLPVGAADYPGLLREIPDPPALLCVIGNAALLSQPQLAVVGSRRATRSGLDTAYQFARELAAAGMTITSGLALGLDASGHRGALEGGGHTVAVLGTGVDVPYPRANRALYRDIAERGALVSEFPPGTPPRAGQFPRRNRIISGLSLGVLVVEAALRSGSLITARLAAEQGREVFAVPGSIHNPQSRGCHALIRDGARLVQCVQDILEEFAGWHFAASTPSGVNRPDGVSAHSCSWPDTAGTVPGLPAAERALLALVGFEPTPVDLLVLHSGQPVAALQPLLTRLELDGWVEQDAGGWLRCR